MILFANKLRWLNKNLPYPILKLWGSSEKAVSLSLYLAFGGKTFDQHYNLLKEMQEWPLDKIYEFQFERLRKILEHAYKNVPYYKERFNKENIKPSDIKCLEDLQKLPIITKDEVIANHNKFFAKNLWYKTREYMYTSGTSGKPLLVCRDNYSIESFNAYMSYIHKAILGYTICKEATLKAPISIQSYSFFKKKGNDFGLYSPITKEIVFSKGFVGDDCFKKYVELIKKFNIRHVEGFPSIFFAFAKYLANKNENIKIKTALTMGEVLYDFQRRSIEKTLGCKVFDFYGQAELIGSAYECCKHNGKHINPVLGVTEVNGCGLKGKGEIVMTTLCNYVWPLIRYSTKDNINLSEKKCGCGCSFPRLMDIKGRNNSFIMLPNGDYLHSLQFTLFSTIISDIKDIFFLQNEDYSLDIFVVKEEKSDATKVKHNIERRIKKILKGKLKVRVIFTNHIERKSMKYTVVETKVNP